MRKRGKFLSDRGAALLFYLFCLALVAYALTRICQQS